jgi:hypothetical protein
VCVENGNATNLRDDVHTLTTQLTTLTAVSQNHLSINSNVRLLVLPILLIIACLQICPLPVLSTIVTTTDNNNRLTIDNSNISQEEARTTISIEYDTDLQPPQTKRARMQSNKQTITSGASQQRRKEVFHSL